MEAFCELFFDNLATLLGVTGAASGRWKDRWPEQLR